MIQRLRLPLLLACALAASPAGVSACTLGFGWGGAAPSEPDAVAAAERIVLVRSVAVVEQRYRYEIEEVLRGEEGGTGDDIDDAQPDPCGSTIVPETEPAGKRYLLFLERSAAGKAWALSADQPERREVQGPGDPLVSRVRTYARIAELGGAAARDEALHRLEREAAEQPERHPAGLRADLERHFRVVTPYSSFARLRALYERAVYPEDRVEALEDMTLLPHAETEGFLRERLASGEDLGPELDPIAGFFLRRNDPADRALVVWAALRSRGGDEMAFHAAELLADSGDESLFWAVLRARPARLADLDPDGEKHPLTPRQSAEVLRLYRSLPEPARELVYLRWTASHAPLSLSLLVAGDDPAGRTARLAGRPAALVRALRAARTPALYRALAIRRFAKGDKEDVPLLFQLLRERPETAIALRPWLQRYFGLEKAALPPALDAWLASARDLSDAVHALWAVATVSTEERVGEAARRLAARLPFRSGGATPAVALLAEAARSAPDSYQRSVLLTAVGRLAGEDDHGLLLDLLREADDAAPEVAVWFLRHPDPAAIPILAAKLDRSVDLSFSPGWGMDVPIASALAAAGDRGVVARVAGILERRSTAAAQELLPIIAQSPLPEALAAARRLWSAEPRMREAWRAAYADPDNRNPRRSEVLAELAGP